jgi:organic radical activating enzyme
LEKHKLRYDSNVWRELTAEPVNTLQLFITNRCNLRCKGCFYQHKLGKEDMPFEDYKKYVKKYKDQVKKVIILGGEPTLHEDLNKMIEFNQSHSLKTTIYTNGFNLETLEDIDLSNVCIRLGVYGSYSSEKPILKVKRAKIPLEIVYMLRKNNVKELKETSRIAEREFDCKGFYISSIRDIAQTHDYWKDTSETLSLDRYAEVIQNFIDDYTRGIRKIHISRRGVIYTDKTDDFTNCCRFGNIFPGGEKIICPFDISKKILSPELLFNERQCNKSSSCLLRKIVLERII